MLGLICVYKGKSGLNIVFVGTLGIVKVRKEIITFTLKMICHLTIFVLHLILHYLWQSAHKLTKQSQIILAFLYQKELLNTI